MTYSIALATYNGETYLREQLDSIAAQSLLPVELQVGDDSSTDRTEQIVRDFAATAPFPVVFHRNPVNLGYGENFLQTAARCRGEWIAFCDQDDVWHRDKLAIVDRAIRRGGAPLMLVAHNCDCQDEAGRSIAETGLAFFDDQTYPSLALRATWLCAGFRQVFRGSLLTEFNMDRRIGAIFRSEEDHGFDPRPHDSWIPFLANMTGEIRTLSDVLVTYRRHDRNATALAAPPDARRGALANNAETYDYEARWFRRAADAMADAANGPRTETIERARRRLLDEDGWLSRRAALYRAGRIGQRLRMLAGLVRSGAYCQSWSMSARSLAKDAAFAVIPRNGDG